MSRKKMEKVIDTYESIKDKNAQAFDDKYVICGCGRLTPKNQLYIYPGNIDARYREYSTPTDDYASYGKGIRDNYKDRPSATNGNEFMCKGCYNNKLKNPDVRMSAGNHNKIRKEVKKNDV
jgi:hypothetical protein